MGTRLLARPPLLWATSHLVERQVDVRTMMVISGSSDYSAIEPCLTEPTES